MLYDILNALFGVSFCCFGKCYGSYVKNGKLICPKCEEEF